MTGADIEQLVLQARRNARRGNRQLPYADLEQALSDIRPEKSDGAIFRAANHEAAHAVAGMYLGTGTITQIALNGAEGNGYVAGYRSRSESLTEEKLMAHIIVCLAGRAAEQEFCGNISAHSGGNKRSDLAQATRIAYALEMSFGLGRQHPLVYREVDDIFAVLATNSRLSELIDDRLKVCYEAAHKIVVRHKKAIEYLAGCLFIWETPDGDRLEDILAKVSEIIETC